MIPVEQGLAAERMFFPQVLQTLNAARLPFLVGGAYAFNCYADIRRPTKDLDLFFRRGDYERIARALRQAGFEVELVFPHWLAKIHRGNTYVDLIYSSGNGIAEVDELWFEHAADGIVLGMPAKLLPAEEMIWSKAFIMERERFDGADIAHLIHARGRELDWRRLLQRFGAHWRVLFSHLVLFNFIYPGERDLVPAWIMTSLLDALVQEMQTDAPQKLCNGTLLSREQYLGDIAAGFMDGRLFHRVMNEEDIGHWTAAISGRSELTSSDIYDRSS